MKRKHIIVVCIVIVVCIASAMSFHSYKENEAKEAYNECAVATKDAYYAFYHEAAAVIEGKAVTDREGTTSYERLIMGLKGFARPFYEFATTSRLPFNDNSGVRDEPSTVVDLYLRIESFYDDLCEIYFLNDVPGNSKKTDAQLKKILEDTKVDIDLVCQTFDLKK